MCGRYYIDTAEDNVEMYKIIEEVNRRTGGEGVKTFGEIFPTDTVPVIAKDYDMSPAVFAMKWGYKLPSGQVIINARSETAAEKPLFREGLRHRRCVVPATNYFEWEKHGNKKTKYAIRQSGSPIMYMAGLYRIEGGYPVFSILTREPADSNRHIHDRMPLILPGDALIDWLTPQYAPHDILDQSVIDVECSVVAEQGPEQMSFLI